MTIIEKLFVFAEPTALALVLVYLYGVFGQTNWRPWKVSLVMGTAFGLCAAAAMTQPIPVAEGIIIDIRNLLVGVAAAFFGVIAGAVALVIGVTTRFSIGGDGWILGATAMTLSCTMGLIWRHVVAPNLGRTVPAFLILGLMISSHVLVALNLPSPLRATFFATLAPLLLVANSFGAVLLGKLITREQALMEEKETLKSEAAFDPLTQLMNRRSAVLSYNALGKVWAKAQGTAMLCIDVDHFKLINDTYGHNAGDHVLIEIANRMSNCLRPDDIFARMSGDEFIIVLQNLSETEAKAVAKRCQTSISGKPLEFAGQKIEVSVSVGCAWHQQRPEFTDFRAAADRALYRAKENGRDCMSFENINSEPVGVLDPTPEAA